jgi:hypothetical protein
MSSFEVALGTLGRALDQLSVLKLPEEVTAKGPGRIKAPPAAVAAPVRKAPVKAAAKSGPTTAGKKAPKKAAATAAPVKAPKAAKAKPVAADGKNSAVAVGRRAVASGERPKLVDAIMIVMGDSKMDSAQVIEALRAKDWAPNAKKLQSYISYMLSSNKDKFERLERGIYQRVKGTASAKSTKASAKAAPAQPATTKAPRKNAAKGAPAGKAERVASTENSTETSVEAAAEAAPAPVVASDPPPASDDTDEVLARHGVDNGDGDSLFENTNP